MSVLEQIALAWQCLGHAFRHLLRPALWTPWLVLGALQALVVVAIWWSAHPWLSWAMVPFVRGAAGDPALHYPNLFRMLPMLFARVDLVVGATLGAWTVGASTALFAASYAGGDARPAPAWGAAFRRALPLVLVNLPISLIALVLSVAVEAIPQGAGIPHRLVWLATLGLTLICQAWFLYATAYVVLEGRGPLSALAELPRAARRGLVAALFLTIVTLTPLLPIQNLASASSTVVERGVPELVGWLILAQIGVALVSSFLLTGSATLVFQSAIARRDESEW